MTDWIYDGRPFEPIPDFLADFRAFVYVIRNKESGKSYAGKKRLQFTSHKRKAGRKTRIKVVKESDWRTYWGSSNELQRDLEKFEPDSFDREIIRFCRTLSESSYYELKYQMEHDVLLYPDRFYNAYVGGRISRKQLGIKG